MDLTTAYNMQLASYDIRKPYCIAQMVFISLEGEALDLAQYWDEPEGQYKLIVWRRYANPKEAKSDPDIKRLPNMVQGPTRLFILRVADLAKEQDKLNSGVCEDEEDETPVNEETLRRAIEKFLPTKD